MDFKYSLLGLFGGIAVIILLLSMIPAIKLSGTNTLTGYNSTNITALNTTPQVFNCTQNATLQFNVTSSVRTTSTLYQQILCAPDPTYTRNITVSLYWNGAFQVTSILNYCNESTSNNFTIPLPVAVGSNIYNLTMETNQCPVNPPLDNLLLSANASCAIANQANGQCLRYFNDTYTYTSGSLTSAENVFLGIIVLFLLLVCIYAVIDKII